MSVNGRELQSTLRTDLSPSVRVRLSRARFRIRQMLRLPSLWAGGRVEEPIFVVGAPRSGTSLLFKVLTSSSHVAARPGEAHEVWERDHHPGLRGWESNVLHASDVTEESSDRIRRSFYLTAGGNRHLIDKTPRNSLRLGFVEELFPDARYVFLHRDGRANVNSLINAWRTHRYRTYRLPEPHAIPGVPDPRWWKFVLYPGWRHDREGPLEVVAAQQWIHANQAILQARRHIPEQRWMSLRYEDFTDRPVEEIARVAEFLNLPFEAQFRAAAAAAGSTPINTVTAPEPGKWKRENPEEVQAIGPMISNVMAALGYDR